MVVFVPGSDDLEKLKSETWSERIERGTDVEHHFDVTMRKLGLHLINQIPLHRETKEERHWPDLAAVELPGILWQVKDGRRSKNWDTMIAEDDSINGCRNAIQNGIKVIIVWEMSDGHFKGDHVENLYSKGAISDDARKHGSGTKATRYWKYSLHPLNRLLIDLDFNVQEEFLRGQNE
jgi:hypothetical protein